MTLADQELLDATRAGHGRVAQVLVELLSCDSDAGLHGNLVDLILVDGLAQLPPHCELSLADGIGDLS